VYCAPGSECVTSGAQEGTCCTPITCQPGDNGSLPNGCGGTIYCEPH
jgi:hypothetical protein